MTIDFVALGKASAKLEEAMAEFTAILERSMQDSQVKSYNLTFSISKYGHQKDAEAKCSLYSDYNLDKVESDRPASMVEEWLRRIKWNETHKPMRVIRSVQPAPTGNAIPDDDIPF